MPRKKKSGKQNQGQSQQQPSAQKQQNVQKTQDEGGKSSRQQSAKEKPPQEQQPQREAPKQQQQQQQQQLQKQQQQQQKQQLKQIPLEQKQKQEEKPSVEKVTKDLQELDIKKSVKDVQTDEKAKTKQTKPKEEQCPSVGEPQTKVAVASSTPQNNKTATGKKTIQIQGAGGSIGATNKELEPPHAKDQEEKKLHQQQDKTSRRIMVQANHFEMKINIPSGTIYHYDIEFQYPWKREIRKSDKPFLIQVIEELKKKYSKIFGKASSVVHDGFKNIYCCHELNLPSGILQGEVSVTDGDRMIDMKATIKYCGSVEVKDALNEYLKRGKTKTRPSDAVQVLNIILGMTPQLHYVTLGRNYFNPVRDKGSVVDLGGGKSLWVGTFQSVRLGWKPFLNVDMANKPAYEEQWVVDFVAKIMAQKSRGPRQQGAPPQVFEIRDKRDFNGLDDELKQLKVKFFRPDSQKREYRINKLMDPPDRLKMKLDTGETITIERYFKTQYKCQLKFPKLPCLHVGARDKTIYLPMEFCQLKRQVAPRSKVLSDREASKMILETAVPPMKRKERILENLNSMNEAFKTDVYAKEFGLSINPKMIEIPARILPSPALKYKQQNDKECEFRLGRDGGSWNMNKGRAPQYKFVASKSLEIWGLLDLAQLQPREKKHFIDKLYEEASSRGLQIEYPTYSQADERNISDVEKKFKELYEKLKQPGKPPQLIMVLVSRKTKIRSSIKFLGDCQLKIPTQFIMKENVVGRPRGPPGPNPQTLHNLCLKINSKLCGVNQSLFQLPPLMRCPVMIMGADVTHPGPGDMKQGKKPSIAAVVASCDPKISKYFCEVRLQYEGQVVEIIKQMEDITKSLLHKFSKAASCLPKKIIYYRDGVSEGQFIEVLNCEMSAIRRACLTMGKDYNPQITFLVAQKRHKTRLFVKNPQDGVGKMQNVPPGTIVDSTITHPTETDFFLASHEGIKGTTKPTHYHLLWDDNNFPVNELQLFTYHLCHLYSRCERSVSYPAPTYYAHLAAFRAREHHNALLDKYGEKKIPEADIKNIEKLELMNFFI